MVSFYENYPKVHYKNSDLFEIINGFLGKKYESCPDKVYVPNNTGNM